MPTTGVLFDVDDTLSDHSGSERAGILAHLHRLDLLRRLPDEHSAVTLRREVLEEQYARFLALLGEDTAAWFAGYTAHRDAAPVLAALTPTHRLGIVSHAPIGQQVPKPRATGLLHHFADTALVGSDRPGEAKPDPAVFLTGCALRRRQVRPRHPAPLLARPHRLRHPGRRGHPRPAHPRRHPHRPAPLTPLPAQPDSLRGRPCGAVAREKSAGPTSFAGWGSCCVLCTASRPARFPARAAVRGRST
ncbi:HAD family hydrolase [Kitasatospora sp. NPDC018619]|uniref:HAD family hydrolase n=1 Tax=unclassified Kitasatospora TaxID=2633591 RepID=UPI0037B7B0F4